MIRRKIEKIVFHVSFALSEFIYRNKYFYMKPSRVDSLLRLRLRSENNVCSSSLRLENFIKGIHDRDKRVRVVKHFKKLKTDGKRNNSQRNRIRI